MTLSFLTATELLGLLARGELSSAELLAHHLERINRHDPGINAFVSLDERAVEEARRADSTRARGGALGPLHGLPITIKDCFETDGLRTTCGLVSLEGHIPERDAAPVARLRAAGAIVFGKTNLPALAADGQSYNPIAGTTNNPWDTTRSPSGSSGGAAAALASGFTSLELGSDIAGSIRLPAHACGVFGLKPSYGVVPLRGHIPGPPGTVAVADMNVAGPLARGAADLELALGVLAGPDEAAATAWRLELPPPRCTEPAEYRLAVWLDDEACPVDSEVASVLRRAVDRLADAGAQLVETSGPVALEEAIGVHRALLKGVACSGLGDEQFDAIQATLGNGLGADDDRGRHMRWLVQTKRDWNALNERRMRMRERWREFFQDHDALLCPVAPVAAIPHDHDPDMDGRSILVDGRPRPYWDQVGWIAMASACYLPAVSVPVGLTASGLPTGLQVVAPYLEDRTAIDLARWLERVIGGFVAPPPLRPVASGGR